MTQIFCFIFLIRNKTYWTSIKFWAPYSELFQSYHKTSRFFFCCWIFHKKNFLRIFLNIGPFFFNSEVSKNSSERIPRILMHLAIFLINFQIIYWKLLSFFMKNIFCMFFYFCFFFLEKNFGQFLTRESFCLKFLRDWRFLGLQKSFEFNQTIRKYRAINWQSNF